MKKSLLLSLIIIFTQSISAQVNFTSSDLPIIVINTGGLVINDEPKITATMGIVDNGPGILNRLSDAYSGYYGKIGIERRGHSSQTFFPKFQYGIELRDDLGNDISSPLLGMPAESDWILNASYTDKSLLRNVIAFKVGTSLGRYASRTKFCEVVINNDYLGIYILQEKIKRDKNRVNIKKLEPEDNSGDALTGGYIIKIDRIDPGDKYFNSRYASIYPKTSSYPVSYIMEYPKAENITPEQLNYIKNYVDQFETTLTKTNYADPFTGYHTLIDIDAWVDYFLVTEFTKATDGYRLSSYMHKDRDSEGGKLVFGPLWDYDLSFGLAYYGDSDRETGWQANLNHYSGNWGSPFWTINFINDPYFFNKLAKRWHLIKDQVFNPVLINKFIDSTANSITAARIRNSQRWPDLFNTSVNIWPNINHFSSYEQEILYLKSWLAKRYNWINTQLPVAYVNVDWQKADLSKIKFEVNKAVKLPLSFFAQNIRSINQMEFVSQDQNFTAVLTGDSVSITIKKQGEYIFKGVAKKNNSIVEVSPEFRISTITSVDDSNILPSEFQLLQNYPNPFNPETTIRYVIPSEVRNPKDFSSTSSSRNVNVTLKVYDILGREVATLVDGEKQAGIYNVKFSIQNDPNSTLNTHHSTLSSGMYFYTLRAGSFFQTKKMIFMK